MNEKIRVTYDLISLMGSVGGTKLFFSWIFGSFVAFFASMNFQSQIANKFYSWSAPASFRGQSKTASGFCCCCCKWFGDSFASKVDYSRELDEKKRDEIPIPPCLSFWQLIYKYVCCWCKGERYTDYQETLAIVNKDMSRNLDVLDLLRRLKMHGFALTA